MAASRIAIVFGAGPGTGAAIARALAQTHGVLLLSRSLPASLPKLKLDDVQDRIHAAGFDGTAGSLDAAIGAARAKWPGAKVAVGVANANSPWSPGPFLDKTHADLKDTLDSFIATWDFAQAFIRAWQADHPATPTLDEWGTLIVTGATMSLRGSANFSAMAPGAWSRRALTQSLAREFGPKGLHVAHAIVDGVILTERSKVIAGAPSEDGTRLLPEDIAAAYLGLVAQRPSAWTAELDLRIVTTEGH
ncbi:hypothetical protein Q8F55_002636 [Vanrija albida]|uniref:Oxidoreductase n=1 Tax=Vanrija albida TaxID=181172 RepID=A0ABR3QAC1_9TREE